MDLKNKDGKESRGKVRCVGMVMYLNKFGKKD